MQMWSKSLQLKVTIQNMYRTYWQPCEKMLTMFETIHEYFIPQYHSKNYMNQSANGYIINKCKAVEIRKQR